VNYWIEYRAGVPVGKGYTTSEISDVENGDYSLRAVTQDEYEQTEMIVPESVVALPTLEERLAATA